MEYFVFLVYLGLNTLENVQPTVWQACHQVGDISEGAVATQKGKNMYFYYHSSKECVKLKREFNGVWSQGWHQEKTLTPCYYDSDSRVSTHGCLQTQTRRDKWAFQLQDGFCLPGTAQVPAEKSCRSLYVIKNYFLFQELVNKRAFPFFSKKHFRFKETLKFEV